MAFTKEVLTYIDTGNTASDRDTYALSILQKIADSFELNDVDITSNNTVYTLKSPSLNKDIVISAFPDGLSYTLRPFTDNSFYSAFGRTCFIYKSNNITIISPMNRGITNPPFGNYTAVFVMDKTNGLYGCHMYQEGTKVKNHFYSGSQALEAVQLPSPKVSQCFMANQVYGNLRSDIFMAITCNPSLTERQECIVNGDEYFIVSPKLGIKLD